MLIKGKNDLPAKPPPLTTHFYKAHKQLYTHTHTHTYKCHIYVLYIKSFLFFLQKQVNYNKNLSQRSLWGKVQGQGRGVAVSHVLFLKLNS